MAEWDNFKALQQAVQDWQRQQNALRDIATQRSLFEQHSIRSLASQFNEDIRLQSTFLNELRSNVAALESAKQSIAALYAPSHSTQLRQLLEQTSLARNAFAHSALVDANPWMSYPWESVREQMEAALRFFPPNAERLEADSRRLLERVESDIATAPLLGAVTLEDRSADGSAPEPSQELLESRLIEVVPAGALADLQAVEFAPLRLLHEAMRDPEFMMQIGPREFEELTAALVEKLGIADVILTPPKSDGGRDVIGTIRTLELDVVVAFECKRYAPDNPVGVATARALLGTISHSDYRADRGVLVTTSRFTRGATNFILTSPKLQGADFAKLRAWLASVSAKR